MKHVITSEWKGNLTFESTIDEHKIINDAPLAAGGDNLGTSPKKLLLVALAGCTGMDVVSILKKMRVNIAKCNISVEADMRDEHPKYYERMHVVYEFTGKDLPMEKLEKVNVPLLEELKEKLLETGKGIEQESFLIEE